MYVPVYDLFSITPTLQHHHTNIAASSHQHCSVTTPTLQQCSLCPECTWCPPLQGLRANLTLSGPIILDNRFANLLILRRAPTVLEMRGAEVVGGLLAAPALDTCAAAANVGMRHPKPLTLSPPMGASYAMLSTVYGSAFSRGMPFIM